MFNRVFVCVGFRIFFSLKDFLFPVPFPVDFAEQSFREVRLKLSIMTVENADMSPYFTDIKLWIKKEESFMKKLTELYASVETSTDPFPFKYLWTYISALTDLLLGGLTSRAMLLYQPGFGKEDGGENLRELMQTYHYLVRTGFILKVKNGNIFMIVHCHAPGALESKEYLATAESFLKETLLRWMDKADIFLYGAIFVGGKMAVYYMDKDTKAFSRLIDGKLKSADSSPEPENWQPIVDEEVLKSLLGIFRKEWYRVDEREFRAAVVCWKLGRFPFRGCSFEKEVAKILAEEEKSVDVDRGKRKAPDTNEDEAIDVAAIKRMLKSEKMIVNGTESDGSDSSKENSPNKMKT